MILRNILNFINHLLEKINKEIRNIYLHSNFYEKKISKIIYKELFYKPSPHLLSSLIKYQTKKININNIMVENFWGNETINTENFKRLKRMSLCFMFKSPIRKINHLIKAQEQNYYYEHFFVCLTLFEAYFHGDETSHIHLNQLKLRLK